MRSLKIRLQLNLHLADRSGRFPRLPKHNANCLDDRQTNRQTDRHRQTHTQTGQTTDWHLLNQSVLCPQCTVLS